MSEEATTTTTTTEATTTAEDNVTAAAAAAAAAATEGGGGGGGGGDDAAVPAEAEESTATFEPVVSLEEVEVKSGEEEEAVVYSKRGKLFIFGETMLDKGSGNKTWRERGIGDVRLLRHRDHGRLRLLMRQDKTMKPIANQTIDPRIVLEPNTGNDRSWVWSAFDFADGILQETIFAVRFANTEIAKEFKEQYEQCQAEMTTLLSGEDKPDTDGTADEATQAVAKLTTKENEDNNDVGAEESKE